MKRRHRIYILLLACIFIFTGCWDQKIFDQLGLMLTYAVEESPDGGLLCTLAYPVIGSKEKDAVGIETTTSTLLRGGRENARLSSPKYMEGGKIQQLLISDSLAKKGIHDLMEIFQRDVTLPAIAYIAVVEGSPQELMTKGSQFKTKPRISFYIYQLLENNTKVSNIPNTKVFDFDINYFAPGLDPVTPIIRLDGDQIKICGSALFAGDKMVGKLDNQETVMLLGLMGQAKNTDFVFPDAHFPSDNPSKYGIAILLKKPKRKIEINFDEKSTPIINITLKYKCALDEYRWNKTDDPKEQQKIEKKLAGHLEALCNNTIKDVQNSGSDPIGIGNLIRAKYNEYWNSIKWEEIYPTAKINVKVQVDIEREGIIR